MWLKQKLGVENADNLFTRHTSPYRTYYEGLMKEPFRFCYPFEKKVVIETKEHDRLIFEIVKAEKRL